MEDPFFPGFWSSRPARPRAAPPTVVKPSRPSKVVSIPIHFTNSDEKPKERQQLPATTAFAAAARPSKCITTTAATIQIQRVVRGFLVRKNLRAVHRLEAEVDAVAREVERTGDRLRRDARERLRVSESLMSLLFRLDALRGVRDYRRRVIRRAIALQEAVDSIAAEAAKEKSIEEAAATANDVGGGSEGNETVEEEAPTPTEIPRSTDSDPEAQEEHDEALDSREEDGGKKIDEEDSAGDGIADEPNQEEALEIPTREALSTGEASEDRDGEQMGDAMQAPMVQDEGTGEVKTGESSAQAPAVTEGEAGQGCGDGMRQAMERMAEESRGLKGLVAELCGRNEMQLRLMDGLLQRVERLEKVVEKMGRKKKKSCSKRKQ